jgi:hypothetical protein
MVERVHGRGNDCRPCDDGEQVKRALKGAFQGGEIESRRFMLGARVAKVFSATRDFGPFFGFVMGSPASATLTIRDLLSRT